MPDLSALHTAIVEGDAKASKSITEQALSDNMDPLEIVTGYLVPAMDEVGNLFEEEEYFIPEMLLSARAMKEAMELIRPQLAAQGSEPIGRAAIGTVKGDLHDIGKNLVASMLEGGGFEVIDLGVDVKPEAFIQAINEKNADLICLSTLLTTTMPSIKNTLEALREAGVRDKVKVMIGGAPITQDYANEVGADGYGDTARSAVIRARELVAK
ncbi:MAG: corrinoid protein [Candidatus Hinthialibacter antarcticus]|nr:corrinoid protein [Candidatus Hinthialibacter antarcticus]